MKIPEPRAEEQTKPTTYIIHQGAKNKKVKGWLREVEDKQLGKLWLVGTEVSHEVKTRKGIERVILDFKMDITGLTYTRKG